MTDLQTVNRIMKLVNQIKKIEDLCMEEIACLDKTDDTYDYQKGRHDLGLEICSILDDMNTTAIIRNTSVSLSQEEHDTLRKELG